MLSSNVNSVALVSQCPVGVLMVLAMQSFGESVVLAVQLPSVSQVRVLDYACFSRAHLSHVFAAVPLFDRRAVLGCCRPWYSLRDVKGAMFLVGTCSTVVVE